jgi:hypothetical protein
VGLHALRVRKTGPSFALAVARCHRHGRAFTVYPPGHVPYGRAAVVPVDEAGREVRWSTAGGPSWADTIWQAAFDAADGTRWANGGTREHRRTQGRRLERCLTLLGLDLSLSEREQERITAALGVPLLTLRETPRESLRAGGSWTERGRAVVQALAAVKRRPGLLVTGHIAGLWGWPSRWDPGGGVLRRLV